MLQDLVTSYADFGMLMRDIGMNEFSDIAGPCDAPTIIRKVGTHDALTIFDKLAMTHTINDMVKTPNTKLPTTTIINHTLSYDEIIDAHKHKHFVLFNNEICIPTTYDLYYNKNNIYTQKLAQAITNGLHICRLIGGYTMPYINIIDMQPSSSKFTCIKNSMSELYKILAPTSCTSIDTKLKRCMSIKYLDACSNAMITSCAPFATSLRTLDASQSAYTPMCGLKDAGLKLCTSLESLDASHNNKITTCEPFAKTLHTLIANGRNCRINDHGLKMCKNITKLHVDNNVHITTCEPFAKTLRILSVCEDNEYDDCVIVGDEGLSMCNHIEELYATGNSEITTCKPFAATLHTLFANNLCGITDDGLVSCTSITTLNTYLNTRITKYDSFGKSLRKLSIMPYYHSFVAENFRSCTSVTELNILNYGRMHMFKFTAFAKTLKKITFNIGSTCDNIDTTSLYLCTSLTDFDASYIRTPIKCDSFAQSLRKLTISYYTEIRDEGLYLCNAIEDFCADTSRYITTCAPFAKSLHTLSIQRCIIGDRGLALCTSITRLDASHNMHVTTCAPFAKSLRILIAKKSGITDAGLQQCTSIIGLNATDNPQITTCDPFIHTIRKLIIKSINGFSQEKLLQISQKNSRVVIVDDLTQSYYGIE